MTLAYTYDVEYRALPDAQHRVFSPDDAVAFAFEVADEYSIGLERVSWTAPGKTNCAMARRGEILLPENDFGCNIVTILHELAHVALPGDMTHGDAWFRWFAFLVRKEIGVMAEASLWWEIKQTSDK